MSQRGHVLIIVQNLPVPLDRRVWAECQALRDAGYRVSVVCPKGPGDPSREMLDGIRLFRYRPAWGRRHALGYLWEFLYAWIRTALLVARVHRRWPIDVLQTCNPPDTYFALARLLPRTRFVYDQHDLCPEMYVARFGRHRGLLLGGLRLLERWTYRTADHVIVPNDSYRRVALARGGLDPGRVTVVRGGPDASLLPETAPDPALRAGRAHLCCYVGVMGPQDHVDNAVAAAAHLVHVLGRRDCHFAFLGFGDCLEELRAQTHRLGLDGWVTFTGRADHQLVARYLATASLGIVPDPRNAYSDLSTMTKTMEYMAFGVPVVAFDLTETRVSAGAAAVYVASGDIAAFAGAIAALLDDPERRERMGRVGRERVEQSLAWRHHAPAYVGVFDALTGPADHG